MADLDQEYEDEEHFKDSPKEDYEDIRSDTEKEAMKQGWVRKEDFKGNPEDHVDAAMFIFKGEMFNKFDKLQKRYDALDWHNDNQAKEFKQQLSDMQEFHESQTQFAIDRLKKDLAKAAEEGDVDEVTKLTNELEVKAKSNKAQPKAKTLEKSNPEPQGDIAFQAFAVLNPWLSDSNDPRTILAEKVYEEHKGSKSSLDIVKEVEKGISQMGNNDQQNNDNDNSSPFNRQRSRKSQSSNSNREINKSNFTQDEENYWTNVVQKKIDRDPSKRAEIERKAMDTMRLSKKTDSERRGAR